MHRACVARRLACYLEKPPTLDYAEMREMLAVEAGAAKLTQVGFGFTVEAERQALKARVLNGELGPVRRVCFIGASPRQTSYYRRAPWAGRLMMDGRLVLDSVIGNAVAHDIHNLLFWAGDKEVLSWGEVTSAEAEMYRAHAIEGMDTVFLRGTCANGIELMAAATHACAGDTVRVERIECENATIRHNVWEPYSIEWRDGRRESIPIEPRENLTENLAAYFAYLRGEAPRPVSSLADTRPYVEFYDLAYVAAGHITQVPEAHVTRVPTNDGKDECVAIDSVREAGNAFVHSGQFPSQQGMAWGRAGGAASIGDLGRLNEVVASMRPEA
jgi:predicted dehydrogenase